MADPGQLSEMFHTVQLKQAVGKTREPLFRQPTKRNKGYRCVGYDMSHFSYQYTRHAARTRP